MMIPIGINGFGRIGRLVLRLGLSRPDFYFVGINDPFLTPEYICYMLRYDSIHGRFEGELSYDDNSITVNKQKIRVFSKEQPQEIDWQSCGASLVIESTGLFTRIQEASKHLEGGASHVIITAPSRDAPNFVIGVNHRRYDPSMQVVSCASCTTNCLAPLVKVVHDRFGVLSGFITTVHAATASQKIVDAPSKRDWRAGRAAGLNIIPASTGAASALGRVIPELDGKLTGIAVRVPVSDVSMLDLTVNLSRDADYEEICAAIREASETTMAGILGYTEDAVVSSDFLGDTRTSIFDARAGLSLSPRFVKLISWYDNEVGYSSKVLDLASHIHRVSSGAHAAQSARPLSHPMRASQYR